MTGGGATPDERRLVVNADDFGFSAGVNRGILEAHAAGGGSSVSVLVNTPGWPGARGRVRAIGGALGGGLHLNLTTGAPPTTAPRPTSPPPGRFRSPPARRGLGRGIAAERCRAAAARRPVLWHFPPGPPSLPGARGGAARPPRAGDDRADGASGPPGRRPRGLGRLHHAAGRRAGRAHVARGAGAVCERGVSPGALRRAVTNSCHSMTSHATRQGIPLMR